MKLASAWLARVRTWWTAGFSLVLLLNLDQFGAASGMGPAPKYWSIGIFLVTVGLFLPGLKPDKLLRPSLFWWAVGYLLLSILWVSHVDNLESAMDGLVLVVTTCLFVGTALLAYPNVSQTDRSWTAGLWLALLLAVASILQEYFNPAAYVLAEAGQGIAGRAAGLYLNPNIAAQALVMILACLMSQGSPKSNLCASAIVLVGLFLTFSRGGLIAWAILVAVATVQGRLPRWFLWAIGLCSALVILAGPQVLDALSIWISPENRNSLDRLAWLLGQGSLSDYSAGERDYIVGYSWRQFLDAPVLGHGLGYMWVWAADVGTHNLILRHLVEYGVVGALIFPLFLYASMRSTADGKKSRWLWLVAGVTLLLSLFSHNMLEQANFLLPWLAMCLMPSTPGRSPCGRVSL